MTENINGTIKEVIEKQEPVITKDYEKKWLIIRQGKNDTKPHFRLEAPSLWRCKKCGTIIASNPEIPKFCSKENGGCGKQTVFEQLTKNIKDDIWILPTWEDVDYGQSLLYQDMLDLIKTLIVFPRDIHYKIFALWIISTWKSECFDAVGFLVFRGIISSGKTRGLNIIKQLGYRAVSASSATFPAIATLSHYWGVTLTIDEADNRLNPKHERGSELLDFVKQSYKKGSMYIVSDIDHKDEVIARSNFGFKAFAGEKTFNPALVSRGIDIFMEKSDPLIPKMKFVTLDFELLRTRLLNYKYKTNDPPELDENYILKGRLREVYESIIRTGMHLGIDTKDIVEFAIEREEEEKEELRSSIQHDILDVIKVRVENRTLDDAPEIIYMNDIVDGIGWSGEKRANQKLGYIVKNMGLKTTRRRDGTVIPLTGVNSHRLGYLYRRYGV